MATQKNKLEEVIHLYLGCELYAEFDDGSSGTFALNEYYLRNIRSNWISDKPVPTLIKPLLRQLSDITEEEKEFIVRCITYNHVKFSSTESALGCWDNEEYGKKIQHMRFYADELQYLLSKGFDLFSLIETGQAIDKNTLKETKN
jgi:hypothetical protein